MKLRKIFHKNNKKETINKNEILTLIKNNQKNIIISLLIFTFLTIGLLFFIQMNTSLATDMSTRIETEDITTNSKSKINFSNDENYIYFNTQLLNKIEEETLYTTVKANISKVWPEARGKDVRVLLERSTDDRAYTTVSEKEITLNGNETLISEQAQNTSIMYYRASIKLDGTRVKVTERNIDLALNVETDIKYNFEFEEKQQEFVTPITGEYRIELWGAAGNYYPNNMKDEVGKGAYTAGTIRLEEDQKLFIYTGKNATDEGNFYTAAFNAGSTAKGKDRTDEYGHNSSSGGGATDVRLVSGEWNNTASLRSRIMVAAGGGGTHYYLSTDDRVIVKGEGGAAGGLIGYRGYQMSVKYPYSFSWTFTEYDNKVHTVTTLNTPYSYTGGGSQKTGGSANVCKIDSSCSNDAVGKNASFGIGGSGANRTGGAGGGGGYYGGGGGGQSYADNRPDSGLCHSSGAGGSSYISGHTGSIAITEDGTPKSGCNESGTTPESYVGTTSNACSIHYSGLKFTDTVMIDGEGYNWTNKRGSKRTMPSYNTDSMSTGNPGSGAARITALTLGAESVLTKLSSVVVTTKYVDEEGKEIATSTQTIKNVGEEYTTTPKDIDGYVLKTTPSNASGTVEEENITVTYVYQKVYKVDYKSDSNGIIVGFSTEEVVESGNPRGSLTTPNTGYHLVNWTANKDVTLINGTKKNAGVALTMGEIKQVVITEDVTFTAHHEINKYTVNYKSDSNGTIAGITTEEVNYNNNPSGSEETPNAGYHFTSWVADKQITLNDGTTIQKGDILTRNDVLNAIIVEDVTFTALHEINTYTINYKTDNDGIITGITTEKVQYNKNPTGTTESSKSGYHFVNWTADKDITLENGTKKITGSILTITDIKNTLVKEDITFTAHYEINKYNIKYETDENGEITGKTEEVIEHGKNPTGTEEESNPGYCESSGWIADRPVFLTDGTVIEKGKLITDEELIRIDVKEDIIFTVSHNRCYGELTILKLDEETKEEIEGVEFKLKNKDGSDAKDIYGESVENAVTSEKGIARFTNILYGEYLLEEVRTNGYYKVLESDIEITFGENEDAINLEEVNENATSYVITNKAIEFNFIKQDKDTLENLENAEFEIRNNDDEVFKKITTEENLNISIPMGEYTLVETEAPRGYVEANTEIKFEILENGNVELKTENSALYKLTNLEETEEDTLIVYNEKELIETPITDSYKSLAIKIIGGIFIMFGGILIYRKLKIAKQRSL